MKDRELVLLTPSQGPSLPQKDNSMSINYLDLQNNPTGLNQLRHRPSQVQESNKSHSARVPEHRFLASKAHVFPLNQATLHNPWICLATQKAELHPAVENLFSGCWFPSVWSDSGYVCEMSKQPLSFVKQLISADWREGSQTPSLKGTVSSVKMLTLMTSGRYKSYSLDL